MKAFLKLFKIKNVPDVSVTITDLLQGEVKEKILHKSTDIKKTLIIIPKYVIVTSRQAIFKMEGNYQLTAKQTMSKQVWRK